MVEKEKITSIAIIFESRNEFNYGKNQYIPVMVEEGYLLPNNDFVGMNGDVYQPMSFNDINLSNGKKYGYIYSINKLLSENPNQNLNQLKDNILIQAKNFIFTIPSEYSVFAINKVTGLTSISDRIDFYHHIHIKNNNYLQKNYPIMYTQTFDELLYSPFESNDCEFEINDLAILFERKIAENGDEEFIPKMVLEGYYNEEDSWFITKDNTAYHHIQDNFFSGNCYGGRVSIAKLLRLNENRNLSEIKQILLNAALQFTYKKLFSANYDEVIIQNIDTLENKKFKDVDSFNFECIELEDDVVDVLNDKGEIVEFNKEKELVNVNVTNDSQDLYPNEWIIKMTPKEIADKVKDVVKGQDDVIEQIVTIIYMNLNFPNQKKTNILTVGPTGSGKTFIFQTLAKVLDIPITIFSVADLSQSGYVGRSTDEIFKQVILDNKKNIEKAKTSIVILDEFDKLAYKGSGSGRVATEAVQDELLTIIESDKRTVEVARESYEIDTSRMTFVLLGAFSEIYDGGYENIKNPIGFNIETKSKQMVSSKKITTSNLISYGIKSEIVGRMPKIAELNQLTANDLKDIILNSKESEFQEKIISLRNIGVTISDENISMLLDKLVENAISKKVGARGILSTAADIFPPIYYEVCNNLGKYCEVVIGENILTNPKDFTLISNEKIKVKARKYGM